MTIGLTGVATVVLLAVAAVVFAVVLGMVAAALDAARERGEGVYRPPERRALPRLRLPGPGGRQEAEAEADLERARERGRWPRAHPLPPAGRDWHSTSGRPPGGGRGRLEW